MGNEGLASAMLSMGANILLSVIYSCQVSSPTKVVFHAGLEHYHLVLRLLLPRTIAAIPSHCLLFA